MQIKATGNEYATTISVLVSAVHNIANTMRLPEGLRLFRGLGGLMDLPREFSVADKEKGIGCKGFVEWGFMSTTSDMQVGGTQMEDRRQIGIGTEGGCSLEVMCV